jgi:hypothetical protein
MLSQPSSPTYYARLQFTDAKSCVDWLESVPLADVTTAHEMVSAQLGLLARTELSALERVRVLEVLYQPVMHLQSELARRFTGRALPLSIVEYSVWNSVLELWQCIFAAYAGCLSRRANGESAFSSLASLVALRCIDITGAQIREHHRVYREIPATLWSQLNECFAKADRQGDSTAEVTDPLRKAAPARSLAAAYGKVLLSQLANPYTMSARQMTVMYRWAGLFGRLIDIDRSPSPPGMTSVLAIDLAAPMPLAPAREITAASSVRYLGAERLGQGLRRMLTCLREGQAPASLGLGEDCRQPATERLLTLLYVQWCGAGMGRLGGPRERLEDARACVGLAAVLRQLESQSDAFRGASSMIRTAYGPLTEQWNVLSAGAPGFIGVTRGPECDERIRHHQLIAIKRRSAAGFQLAVTQWLKLEDDGDLAIGLRLWAGAPQPVRLRIADDDGAVTMNAVALPAVPEMRLPETVVLEPGVFQPNLQFEFASDGDRKARLTRLTERGADFERAAFEVVS